MPDAEVVGKQDAWERSEACGLGCQELVAWFPGGQNTDASPTSFTPNPWDLFATKLE